MKQITTITTVLVLAILFACEQKPKTETAIESPQEVTEKPKKIVASVQQTIDSLKKIIGNSWVKQNPTLEPIGSSFFTKENENSYFVCPLQISGMDIPFVWDGNFSLAEFLLARDSNTTLKKGIEADNEYKGTKIIWNKTIAGLIWLDNKTYKSTITDWYVIGDTDCPGTISFPSLSFQKIGTVTEDNVSNPIGLAIVPYMENGKIKSSEAEIKEKSGKTIQGTGYDINGDGILDIFSYTEAVEEMASYTRLYINVSGQWKCKWVHLDEECI